MRLLRRSPATQRPAPPRHEADWDLQMRFLRSFDTYETALEQAVRDRTGASGCDTRERLPDRLNLLRDLGLHDDTSMARWARCLAIRHRLLVPHGDDTPSKDEIEQAASVMGELRQELFQPAQPSSVNQGNPEERPG